MSTLVLRTITVVLFLTVLASSNLTFAVSIKPWNSATQLLEQSNNADTQSKKQIIKANSLRKKINVLRARSRKSNDATIKQSLTEQASDLSKELEQLQLQGANLRTQSLQQRAHALQLFEELFCKKWENWVSNRKPLTMDDSVTQYIAHNTNIRSTHPGMLNKMGKPTDISEAKRNVLMSIQVPVLIAQNAPPNLDISSFQISREEKYFAHIEVHSATKPTSKQADTNNNVAAVPLNKMHKWRLLISDLNGQPVTGANITVAGHMPGHVHGLPTQPRVTREIADGIYQVEGLKFQMKGWWVIQFLVNNPDKKPDNIKFNLVL